MAGRPRASDVALAFALALPLLGGAACERGPSAPGPVESSLRLEEWERGLRVRSLRREGMDLYLWFYEWNLFGAFQPGELSDGTWELAREVSADGRSARLEGPGLRLELVAVGDAVELSLTVENRTDRTWSELAAIVPCLNPGPREVRNFELANRKTTWFAGEGELLPMPLRDLHWNAAWRERAERELADGGRPFHERWPQSEVDAARGLVLRTSRDGSWSGGIAWEDFLFVQGNNFWQCMHLAPRIGALEPGASRTLRGRLYLGPLTKEALFQRFQAEFGE